MPYNSETGAYERRSSTIIDATPDGDTVAVAIDDKLDLANDDAVLDLNHHAENGNHYPATGPETNARYLKQSPAGVVAWANGVPLDSAVEASVLAASGGADLVGYGAETVKDRLDGIAASGGASGVGFISARTGAVARTVKDKLDEAVHLKDFGVSGNGVADDTAAVQLFLNACAGRVGFISPGKYKINGSLQLPNNATIKSNMADDAATMGAIFYQYGDVLFDQPDDLFNCHLSGLTFDLQASSPSPIKTICFKLGSHMRCVFDNLRFIRYTDASIVDRCATPAATLNTIDNKYTNWYVSACSSLDFAVGLEGYYYKTMGNGVTTSFNTGLVLPERTQGSAVVLRESKFRVCTELVYGTDYSVSYDGSNRLIIGLTSPLAADQRIHVWPSQPRLDGNRRPISNNLWENIRVDYLLSRGHQSVRWVDAETYDFERLLLAADYATAYVLNPYLTRTGQGGDYATFKDSIIGKQMTYPALTNPESVKAFDFGPGSYCLAGSSIRMDQVWRPSSTALSYMMTKRDGYRTVLTGTVSGTIGSPVVTGSGTVFQRQLTLIGATPDMVEIGGTIYGILSIDSQTQLTLATNLTANATSASVNRINVSNGIDGKLNFSSMGDGYYANRVNQSGDVIFNSVTEKCGSVVLPANAASVVVTHGLRRTPVPGEINLISYGLLGGRSLSISAVGTSTFQINLSSTTIASDITIGWSARLLDLN